MTNHTTWRRPFTAVAALIAAGSLVLGGCSKSVPTSAADPVEHPLAAQDTPGSDTVDLVDAAVDMPAARWHAPDGAGGPALRTRLFRALHATWVTNSPQGPVTHQAIRGDVTAVSATSITVKAKDGVSLTFVVNAETRVRMRIAGSGPGTGAGPKGTDSTIDAVRVGAKALVVGVGKTAPTARAVIHLDPAPTKPGPSATS